MAVVQPGEGGVVGPLAAERLDRADAVHGLGELHDEGRGGGGLGAVDAARAALEGADEEVERPGGDDGRGAQAHIQPEQRRGDVEGLEDDDDQFLEALVEEFAQRLDVGGGPGYQPAGGVALVEVQAQGLAVAEDPAAQIAQHVLADPGGEADEGELEAPGQGGAERGRHRHRDQWPSLARPQRRYGTVEGVRHEQRARLHGGLLDQQHRGRQPDPGPVRRQQGPQQGARGVRGSGQHIPFEGVGPVLLGALGRAGLLVVAVGRRMGRGGRHRASSLSWRPGSPDISAAYSALSRSSS